MKAQSTIYMQSAIEKELGAAVGALYNEEQEWSASDSVHIAGVWQATKTPILIKLGINANQLYWTQQMAATAPEIVPHLFASGERLGELPINWVAIERINGGQLGPGWNGTEFDMLLRAAVRWQCASRTIEPCQLSTMDAPMLRKWLAPGVLAYPPGPVEKVIKRLESDWGWLATACEFEVCHGDVHMCNVLARLPPPEPSDAVLIDCQPIRQPWAFDAAYPQILNSIDRSRVGYRDLVPKMARVREAHGLSFCTGRDLEKLERITLAWFAIRLWGLTPDRHAIPDYRAEIERYITESADS